MEIGGRFRSADLLHSYAAGAVDVAVSLIIEEQWGTFGDIPREVASCTGDSLRCAQSFTVIGVAIFDLGDRFFFGPFNRGEVAGLVVAVGRSPSFFGSHFRALAEFVVGVRRTGAFFELVAFVEGVCARPLLGGVVGRVVFIFGASVFREAVVF